MTPEELKKLLTRNKGKGLKKPTANQTTKAVIALLSGIGYIVWRNNTTGIWDAKKQVFRKHHGRVGIPDVIGYQKKTGRFIAVEIKAGKDKLSPEQDFFIKEVNRFGGIAMVVRSVDDLLEQLQTIKK
jgi:hypothetical protein